MSAGSRPRQPPVWRLLGLLLVLVTCRQSSHSSSALVFQCSHVGAEDDADMGPITTTISTTISAVSTLQLSFCGRAGVDIAAALDTMGDKGLCIM